jgi:hypothetical protein
MKNIVLKICLLFISTSAFSQEAFVRSSMSLVLIEDFGFDNGPLVRKAYENYPFPVGVYNNHQLPQTVMNLNDYILSPEEEVSYGINKSEAGKLISAVANESTAGIVQDNSKVEYQLQKYIKENKLAHESIKKWFNITEDGNFDQNYVQEMIQMQMTEEQKLQAVKSGSASAARDANREFLINNTYAVFTRMNFVSNEIVAVGIREIAYQTAEKNLSGLPLDLAKKAADKIYEKTSEGFSVWTSGWLFDLVWGPEEMKMLTSCAENGKLNLEKFYAQPFKMSYLGKEKATSLVTFSLKKGEGDRTDEEIIDLSTIRNVDKVLVKLQRAYDQFMPIFPIQQDTPIGAYLGVKEGIEGGEKFDVLGPRQANGEYKVLGTISVDKSNVWDNSYGSEATEGMTLFKGKLPKGAGKDYGTLLRQKR